MTLLLSFTLGRAESVGSVLLCKNISCILIHKLGSSPVSCVARSPSSALLQLSFFLVGRVPLLK